MTTLVLAVLVVSLALALVAVVAAEPGVPPGDVALAYENAWDRLDFEALWAMSGNELRDGMGRAEFVRAKQAAYADRPELRALAHDVRLDGVEVVNDFAIARTRLELREGGGTTNQIQVTKRGGRWVVVGYQLEPESPPAAR